MKKIKKTAGVLGLSLVSLVSSVSAETNSSSRQFDNFSDNNIDPFEVCTTNAPQFVGVVSKRVKTVWQESGYNGGRRTRGAEFCGQLQLTGNVRSKFQLRLPTAGDGKDGKIRYPDNKDAAVAQIFCFAPDTCNDGSFWMVILSMEGNDLWVEYRGSCGMAQRDKKRVQQNVERNKNHTIEILVDPSNNSTGSIEVKYNGSTKVNETGINLGTSDSNFWNNNDNMRRGAHMTAKYGQYAHDTGNYTNNEERTVYYDKVTWEKN